LFRTYWDLEFMSWAFRIARIAGIDVRVHFTFLLLLGWFGVVYYEAGGARAAAFGVAFILLLFLCVLLHEFGHAFAARAFGIRTPDITLLPIGGVARLERMPRNPMQELIVAVAGPAVNVVIAAVLFVVIGGVFHWSDIRFIDRPGGSLLVRLMQVNVLLVLFNLIPAFPMDGGRILRALLATSMDHVTATQWAARVGQVIAVLFAIYGALQWNPFLLLIAMFVFSGAQQEAAASKMMAMIEGRSVRDAMLTRFRTLGRHEFVGAVIDEIAREEQPVYPVVDEDLRPLGLAGRNRLIEAARDHAVTARISDVCESVPAVSADGSFEDAFMSMQKSGSPVLPVINPAGQLVGLVSLNLLRERGRAASKA
jgi:Zn-dependent protease